ncbi:MAG: sialate O-acetylesterase [Planctomycetia bacterium]|nr:sialate O-acetylesterase [Planctomycetia bacterium]
MNLFRDGSFESVGTSYTPSTFMPDNGYIINGNNDPPSGNLDTAGFWQYETTGTRQNGYVGFYAVTGSGTAFTNAGAGIDDGAKVAALQVFEAEGTASLSQTISNLTPGAWYMVSYDYNSRFSNVDQLPIITTSLGEIALETNKTVSQTTDGYQRSTHLVQATDTSMTFSVQNEGKITNPTYKDWDLLFDNARMYAVTGKVANLVKDGSFEGVGTTYTPTNTAKNYGNGYLIWGTTDPSSGNLDTAGFWQYESSGNMGYYANPTSSHAFCSNQTIPDGTHAAAMQVYGNPGTASISQEITGLQAGNYYALAYRYNARPGNQGVNLTATWTDSSGTTELQNTSVTPSTDFHAFATTFQANGTSATLKFANVTQPDNSLTIDDVQMVAVPAAPVEAGYTPIHALDMTTATTTKYNTAGVPYAYDATVAQKNSGKLFDRVGYVMELVDLDGNCSSIFVSMDAFTQDISQIGVPASSLGTYFAQTPVRNLEVVSDVDGISRTLATGGTLEFWSGNYSPGTDGIYNHQDVRNEGNGFGSMQIHDSTTGETLMAFNGWGSNGTANATAGIGNSTPANFPSTSNNSATDWTFTNLLARGEYLTANLYTFVRESDAVLMPDGVKIFQRDAQNQAEVKITGNWNAVSDDTIAKIQISENGVDWIDLENFTLDTASKTYAGTVSLGTGWHEFQIQALDASGNVLTSTTTEKIGVGDIFITAGQSNSANHGAATQSPTSGNVYALDIVTGEWKIANDPQPGATGSGGSTWPSMGDTLSEMLGGDIPIGFVSTGVGGSSVSQWNPDEATSFYNTKLLPALELLDGKVKAILWHQGETDSEGNGSSMTGDRYAELLNSLIEASREDAGVDDLAWMIALVSYFNGMTDEELRAAQMAVINGDENVFLGPDSDALLGVLRAADGVHFSADGLQRLGELWAMRVGQEIYGLPEPSTAWLLILGSVVLWGVWRKKNNRE